MTFIITPMKTVRVVTCAAALLGAAATSRAAGPFSLNFDGPGATADAFRPIFLTIGYGVFEPQLDAFGDPIPGSERWTLDNSAGPVPVQDPSSAGWGAAPSGTKALDARDQTVLMVFDVPFSFSNFTATLDNSSFGNLTDTDIRFYGANDALIFSAPVNQATPGAIVNVGALNNVKTIVLPTTAFYDNVAVVPEPSTGLCVLGGLGMLMARRRRKG